MIETRLLDLLGQGPPSAAALPFPVAGVKAKAASKKLFFYSSICINFLSFLALFNVSTLATFGSQKQHCSSIISSTSSSRDNVISIPL